MFCRAATVEALVVWLPTISKFHSAESLRSTFPNNSPARDFTKNQDPTARYPRVQIDFIFHVQT